MIRLFHIKGSRSARVVWILEELGLNYELIHVKSGPGGLEHPELEKLNPLRTVPTFTDGTGVVLVESGAIVEYLVRKYSPTPMAVEPSEADYPLYLQWMWFAEASLSGPLISYMMHTRFYPEHLRRADEADHAAKTFGRRLHAAEHLMGSRQWAAADRFTAADIMLAHTLYVGQQFGLVDAEPRVFQDYMARVTARPAFQKALSA